MNEYASCAALIIAVVGFCINFGMFVRPVELEKKHREIIEEVESKFKEFQDNNCKDHKSDSNARFDRMEKNSNDNFNLLFKKVDELKELFYKNKGG